jgi:hypothetical protein
MLDCKGKRLAALGLAAAGLIVVPAAVATAQLPGLPHGTLPELPPLPVLPPPPVVLPPLAPLTDPGAVVADPAGEAVGEVLDGGHGALSDSTLQMLLQVLVVPAPDAAADTVAPTARITVLSRLRQIARTGSLRLLVTTDEPGIVAVGSSVRPGPALRGRSHGHSRRVVRWPSTVLTFRSAGALRLTLKLDRRARIALGRSRDARLKVGTIAADVRRNQRTGYVVRRIRR